MEKKLNHFYRAKNEWWGKVQPLASVVLRINPIKLKDTHQQASKLAITQWLYNTNGLKKKRTDKEKDMQGHSSPITTGKNQFVLKVKKDSKSMPLSQAYFLLFKSNKNFKYSTTKKFICYKKPIEVSRYVAFETVKLYILKHFS